MSLQPSNKSHLPKLTLQTFSWFNAAVNANLTLSQVQKFSYLNAQLQGEAARAIAGLPLTELNYTHSISLLKERFGQPQKLVNAHI